MKNKDQKAYFRAWYARNRESVRRRTAKWREENPRRMRAIRRAWYAKNSDKVKDSNTKWRKKNLQKVRATQNAYREKNPQKARDAIAKWRQKNPDYCRIRYNTDSNFRVLHCLRTRLGAVIKGKKANSTMILVGCSIPELCAHLERQFKPGMTWKNYGPVWHIDHIRPCASFDLSDPAQQRACFHFTNLQPLFAKENISKGAKYAYCK